MDLICIAPCAAAQLGEDLAAICFAAIGKRAGRRDDMIMIPIMPKNTLTEVSSEIALTDDYHAGAAFARASEVSYLILGKVPSRLDISVPIADMTIRFLISHLPMLKGVNSES